jgi:hypothetical protein
MSDVIDLPSFLPIRDDKYPPSYIKDIFAKANAKHNQQREMISAANRKAAALRKVRES